MKISVLYEFVKIFSCIAEIYMVIDFCKAFHNRKEYFKKTNRICCFLSTAFITSVFINLMNNNVLNMIFVPLIWMIILFVVFEDNLVIKFKTWLLFTFVMQSSELIFAVLLSIPVNVPTNEYFFDDFWKICSIIAVKLISYIILIIIKQNVKTSNKHLDRRIFLSYIFLPLATLGIMVCIPYVRAEKSMITKIDMLLIVMYIFIFVGNITLFYFFEQYNISKDKQIQQQIELVKYKEKQWHYSEIDRMNKKNSIFIHNINHYLKQIGFYAEKLEVKQISRILDDLKIEFYTNENTILCSNILLNALLIDFKERAKSRNINSNVFVEDGFNIEFLSEIDTAALFGNLLENAMEAAEKCSERKIDIKLFMQNEGRFSVIRIQNTYFGNIIMDGERYLTSKNEPGQHGIGINNCKEIVYKYSGLMTSEFENQIFTTTIILPINN